ncbi:MAG: RHS repeat-associated core domain-containing protein, partial [Acetobacterium sp.]|nr:RHS repeat-associated core domain-containing protein [Acetobacterium sp.]
GVEVVKYTYDSWGKPISITDTSSTGVGAKNPYRYRGYRYDNESGLYYLQSRYYDPSIKRFISADTLSVLTSTPMALTDKNLYAYCDNNPIVREDDGGEFWNVIIGAAVGGTVGVAGQLLSDLATSWLNGNWTFSSMQTYTGALVGGAVGGAILGGTGNIALANAASGIVTTGVGLSLEKLMGVSNKSWSEIGVNAVVDGVVSYGLGKIPGIQKITKGRNSMSAVYKSGLTKLRNGTAVQMSYSVYEKGLISSFVGGFAMDAYIGIKQQRFN